MERDRKSTTPQNQVRVRPKLYGVALYLVAGILLIQVLFCISVFVLRPYAQGKTPEGILNSERAKAGEWWGGVTHFLQSRVAKGMMAPRGETNAPVSAPR
jgi:hypothetical protein